MRRDDPLVREAALIAEELDHGNAQMALNRLQEDLQRLQNYPDAQIQLTANVFRFDRRGQGIDLQARKVERDGYIFAELSARDADRHGRNGQSYRFGMLFLGEDPRYGNGRHTRFNQHDQHGHGHDTERHPGNRHYEANDGFSYRGLTPEATSALIEAQKMAWRHGVRIQINSAGRSYQEQARLYRQLNGIRPVAAPGTSNHESGEAIDVKNYAQAKPFLQAAGFVHGDGKGPIRNDPWHFRYMG